MSNYEEAPFEDVVPAVGQRLAMGEVTDQPGAGAGAQAVHDKLREMRARAPWRNEFGSVRYQPQHTAIPESIDQQAQQFLRRRVGPLRVFHEYAKRLVGGGGERRRCSKARVSALLPPGAASPDRVPRHQKRGRADAADTRKT